MGCCQLIATWWCATGETRQYGAWRSVAITERGAEELTEVLQTVLGKSEHQHNGVKHDSRSDSD